MSKPGVSAVVLAWGAEPTLDQCVEALASSRGVDLEVIVVDNGCDPTVIRTVEGVAGVRVLGPPQNRGFAGGCNYGVAAASKPIVALVNSDAYVDPEAVARLAASASAPDVGIASASLRLAQEPDRLNSAGNPVHFTGLTWSGSFGSAAADHAVERDVPSATGAAMALRRSTWDLLGGFDEEYFAYLEDTDLSLRCWQVGLRVVFVPDAVVLHDYEFSRNDLKLYLLERNRLLLLATLYRVRSLVLLAPALLLFELAMVAQAVGGRWLGQKLRGWSWLVRHRRHVMARRRVVQAARRTSDAEWTRHLCGSIDPKNVTPPPGMGAFNMLMSAYWRLARPLL